jgi:serine/threonine-protein kinase
MFDGLTPGTPIYMSPEQAAGRDIGPACDVYSLGVIAYEALTGSPPFDGRTLAEVVCMHLTREPVPLRARCNAPAELCALVARMLHKDPRSRPNAIEIRQSCRAIALELSLGALEQSQVYEEFELSGVEQVRGPATRTIRPAQIVSDEAFVVDPDALEYGVTEMLPVVPRPRWTPEIARVPSVIAVGHRVIGPRAPRDQIAGEIVLREKSH